MKMMVAVALGGAVGAAGRYWLSSAVLAWSGPHFPWGTMLVNILGALAMGMAAGWTDMRFNLAPQWQVFLVPGLLGGFTTFSAFSLEFVTLIQRKELVLAGLYATGSLGVCALALLLGLFIVQAFSA